MAGKRAVYRWPRLRHPFLHADPAISGNAGAEEMRKPVMANDGGAEPARPVGGGVERNAILVDFGPQRVRDGVAMHDDMVELLDVIEKSRTDPSQVVIGLCGERDARAHTCMHKAESAGNLMGHRAVQEADMMASCRPPERRGDP